MRTIKNTSKKTNISIVEIDIVEGCQNENGYSLTLHFVKFKFKLAYYIHEQKADLVLSILNQICKTIDLENFKKLFMVILTDNGKEFSNPLSIIIDSITEQQRTKVFFCDSCARRLKGSCEKKHEFIKYIIPKYSSLLNLS